MEYVWYGLLLVFGIFVILISIALIRAIWIEKEPIPYVQKPIDEKLQLQYGQSLSAMIQVPTVSHRDQVHTALFEQLQNVMANQFPTLYEHTSHHVFDNGALVWIWKGKDSSIAPLVLMAHQDVVPADEALWKHPPFGGVIEDGVIYGRGTMDTKNTLFAIFQAGEEWVKQSFVPTSDIYFCSSADEEVSGGGARATVEWLKELGIRPGMVLDEGGAVVTGALPSSKMPLALIGVLEKGYVNLKISAQSSGGHASMPPKNTPIARLAKFVTHVENKYPLKTKMIPEVKQLFEKAAPSMKLPYRFLFGNMWLFKGLLTKLLPIISPYGRAMLSTTMAFTMMEGSKAENVIPFEAFILCNVRTHPIQGIQSTLEALEPIAKKYRVKIEALNGREASPTTSTASSGYQFLSKAIQVIYPESLVTPYIMLGGTDSREYTDISDCVLRFSPMRATNEELKKIHGIDESISLHVLAESVQFYKYIIEHYESN
jgi:carboxypeptidase PM20D1